MKSVSEKDMFVLERNTEPPQLLVRISGRLELQHLIAEAPAFELEVARLSPGFVLLLDLSALEEVTAEASGVVFYLTQQVFQARPGAVLVVRPPRTVHASLRPFAERQDTEGRLHLFDTLDEAKAFLLALPATEPLDGPAADG